MVFHLRIQSVPRRLGEDEVPLRIAVQIKRELVEVMGDMEIVVEILVEIRLAVSVEVDQPRDEDVSPGAIVAGHESQGAPDQGGQSNRTTGYDH